MCRTDHWFRLFPSLQLTREAILLPPSFKKFSFISFSYFLSCLEHPSRSKSESSILMKQKHDCFYSTLIIQLSPALYLPQSEIDYTYVCNLGTNLPVDSLIENSYIFFMFHIPQRAPTYKLNLFLYFNFTFFLTSVTYQRLFLQCIRQILYLIF